MIYKTYVTVSSGKVPQQKHISEKCHLCGGEIGFYYMKLCNMTVEGGIIAIEWCELCDDCSAKINGAVVKAKKKIRKGGSKCSK